MKVTIIGFDKWGYNKYIVRELERRGIKTRHIDYSKLTYEYPTYFHKGLNFITKTLFNFSFKRLHLNRLLYLLVSKQDKQDVILVIKGDDLSVPTLKMLRNNTKELFAFFNDSMDRYPRMKKIHSYFDKVYSFDSKDVEKYDLEFISNYIYFDMSRYVKEKTSYNIFNIGSLHKRSQLIPQFVAYFKEHNIQYKLIACHEKGDILQLEDNGVEIIDKAYPLKTVFLDFVTKSDILLDMQRPHQKGLSFRIMEGIGLKKKIITTNTDIVNYDFYNPNNIAVVDSNNIEIDEAFFNTPYQDIAPEILNSYHISSWVNNVFNLGDKTNE